MLVLALQAEPEPQERYTVAFSRLAQYWVPRFRGKMRVDGNVLGGTDLDFTDDLNLPDRVAMPILSGGDIGFSISSDALDRVDLLFAAEYWTHQWAGHELLASDETLGDRTFPAGSTVDSRLTLTSLSLDIMGVFREGPFRVGVAFSLLGTLGRIRMDSLPLSSKERIEEAWWGGGPLFEVHPVQGLFIGGSAKGFSNFRHPTEGGVGDFRGYVGVEWKMLRLEAGYRAWVHQLEVPEKTLNYFLHGPYAALGLVIRF